MGSTADLWRAAVLKIWPVMREEAQRKAMEEPILGSYFHATILNHKTFGDALSFRLASKRTIQCRPPCSFGT